MKLQRLFSASLALVGFGSLSTSALAWQGQPVTPDDRDVGFVVRELVEGLATGPGGVPQFTITGTPGAFYEIFGGITPYLLAPDVDTAAVVAGVRGAVSAPLNSFPAGLFAVPVGTTFGVIPASGRHDLNLSAPLPAGFFPLHFDLQLFVQQPGGSLDLSNGQIRQVLATTPTGTVWATGPAYPTSIGVDWADIEQGDVDGDGDLDTIGVGDICELWLTTGGTHVLDPGRFPGATGATTAELADLDRDGFLDVAIGFLSGFNTYLRVFRNNGLSGAGVWNGFTQIGPGTIAFTGTCSVADLEIADVNGDGFRDIMLACASNPILGQRNRLFISRGSTSPGLAFGDQTITNLPVIFDDSEDCEFLDFDLDGDNDVVIANVDGDNSIFGTGVDYILVNQGGAQGGVQGMFLAPMPNPVPAINDESLDVAVGDIDGDGRPDLYFTNWSLSSPSGVITGTPVRDRLYLNRLVGGATTFVDFSVLLPDRPAGPNPATLGTDAEIFDVDFDGDLDIVTALGTLGILAPGVPNSSLGVQFLTNTGSLVIPFPRTTIPGTLVLDFRDIEHGDWREIDLTNPLGLLGPFGQHFDKDFGCATIEGTAQLSTFDHD